MSQEVQESYVEVEFQIHSSLGSLEIQEEVADVLNDYRDEVEVEQFVNKGDSYSFEIEISDHEYSSEVLNAVLDEYEEDFRLISKKGGEPETCINGKEIIEELPGDMTELQHEALTTAYEEDFYEIPREVSMDELSEEFDISQQALGERIRRATGNLVEEYILDEK